MILRLKIEKKYQAIKNNPKWVKLNVNDMKKSSVCKILGDKV